MSVRIVDERGNSTEVKSGDVVQVRRNAGFMAYSIGTVKAVRQEAPETLVYFHDMPPGAKFAALPADDLIYVGRAPLRPKDMDR